MHNFRARRLAAAIFLIFAALSLSSCSYLTGLFPDKQKQYRFSSDLPPLEIPPDLSSSTIDGAVGGGGTGAAEEAESGNGETQAAADENREESAPDRSAERRSSKKRTGAPKATLAEGSDGVPLIEVEAPFQETWDNVSRALGRLEIEVTDQNRSDGMFYVYYGLGTRKAEDRGIWGDITAIFSSDEAKAEEYRIKLEEHEEVTYVFVLNKDGKGTTEGAGLDLLKRINEKLQTIDKAEPENKEPAGDR